MKETPFDLDEGHYRQCEHGGLSIADTSQGTPDDHNDVDCDDGEESRRFEQNTNNIVLTLKVASMPILEIVFRPSSALRVSH